MALRRREEGEKDWNDLRVSDAVADTGFDLARSMDSHQIAMDGWRSLDRNWPRRGWRFSGQAQVAAWAWGSRRARRVGPLLGHERGRVGGFSLLGHVLFHWAGPNEQ